MKLVKLVVLIALAVALAAVVVQNQAGVEVHFLWLTGKMPAIVLLLLTTAGGFVVGVLVALLTRGGAKSKSTPAGEERKRGPAGKAAAG